jgi:hypothetical protein
MLIDLEIKRPEAFLFKDLRHGLSLPTSRQQGAEFGEFRFV